MRRSTRAPRPAAPIRRIALRRPKQPTMRSRSSSRTRRSASSATAAAIGCEPLTSPSIAVASTSSSSGQRSSMNRASCASRGTCAYRGDDGGETARARPQAPAVHKRDQRGALWIEETIGEERQAEHERRRSRRHASRPAARRAGASGCSTCVRSADSSDDCSASSQPPSEDAFGREAHHHEQQSIPPESLAVLLLLRLGLPRPAPRRHSAGICPPGTSRRSCARDPIRADR